MPTFVRLDESEILAGLKSLTGWSVENGKLFREFKFNRFVEAFGFMASVATLAEKQDHHPDWSNAYNKVQIRLMTEEAAGITINDLTLAGSINEIYAQVSQPSQDELAKVLDAAGRAHHDYEQICLNGVRDELWPGFYAAYALGRLGDFVAPSKLSGWLEESPSQDHWPSSAAAYVFARLKL